MDNSKKLTLFRDGSDDGVGFVDISNNEVSLKLQLKKEVIFNLTPNGGGGPVNIYLTIGVCPIDKSFHQCGPLPTGGASLANQRCSITCSEYPDRCCSFPGNTCNGCSG